MFTEEKMIQALKNFSLREMFNAVGQDPNQSLPSENDIMDGSFHSASGPMMKSEMILDAQPYEPKSANLQCSSETKPEQMILSESLNPEPEKVQSLKMDELDLHKQINIQLQEKLDKLNAVMKSQHTYI